MVIGIVIISLIAIGAVLMGWINGVQLDIWVYHIDHFLWHPFFSVCTMLPVIVICFAFLSLAIPRVELCNYPKPGSRRIRIRRKFILTKYNFVIVKMSGSPGTLIGPAYLFFKKLNQVKVNIVKGGRYYYDKEEDALVVTGPKMEVEKFKHIMRLYKDEKSRSRYWQRMATRTEVIPDENDEKIVSEDIS